MPTTGTAAADAEVAAATEAAAARSTASTPGAAATATFHTPLEEEPPLGAHSPFSALHTGSLDGYLEPQRLMSWGSPPPESFPVFSPPPYGVAVRERPPGPPWMPLVTPRASLCLSSPRSHQTCTNYLQVSTSSRCIIKGASFSVYTLRVAVS